MLDAKSPTRRYLNEVNAVVNRTMRYLIRHKGHVGLELQSKEKNNGRKTIEDFDEFVDVITEYGDKEFYFRGENKDFKESFCLPAYIRYCKGSRCMKTYFSEGDHEWFIKKLEDLCVEFPYIPLKGNSDNNYICNVFANMPSALGWNFGNEKVEALKAHYSPDFNALKKVLSQTD